jgi:CheY-like chemotaxis protein
MDTEFGRPGEAGRGKARPIGVLVADDEPIVRAAIRRGLIARGFAVWDCADGHEAVTLYRKHASEIDVVLLDVHMPVIDGLAASSELRDIDSTIRLCFMTGDPAESTRSGLVAVGARFIFGKPFSSIGDVAETLARIARDQSNVDEHLNASSTFRDSYRSPKSVPQKRPRFALPYAILRLIQWPVLRQSSPAKSRDVDEEAD